MGVWQGEFPAFPSHCEHWMWQLCWWVKEEGDTETIAFALFTESFDKQVLDLQGATFAQKLSCAQSIFIFTFNLYHIFSLYRSQWWFQLFIYIYMCAYICISYICICVCAIWVLMSWWLWQGYVLQVIVVPTPVVCSCVSEYRRAVGTLSIFSVLLKARGRTGTLIYRLNQWKATKEGESEKDFIWCLFTVQCMVQKSSFCLSPPLYMNLETTSCCLFKSLYSAGNSFSEAGRQVSSVIVLVSLDQHSLLRFLIEWQTCNRVSSCCENCLDQHHLNCPPVSHLSL